MKWTWMMSCGICAIAAQGCYTGFHEAPDPGMGPLGEGGDAGGEGEGDDAGGEDDGEGEVAQCLPPLARIWKLTPRQYDTSLRGVLPDADPAGLPDLALADRRFSNEADHNDLPVEVVRPMFRHAEQQAARVVADPTLLAPCLGDGGLGDDACLEGALSELLARAYRRPATPEERSELVDYVHERAAIDGGPEALGLAVQSVLGSPSFLFRTELGDPADEAELVELDAYETASALSYFLLDGPPDELLLTAAAANELYDPDVRATHARRLLAEANGSNGLQELFTDLTHTRGAEELQRDSVEYPGFSSELARDMKTELDSFVAYVLTEDDARFETLLTASYSILSPRLAEYYGVAMEGEDWARVELPADQRAGLVTNPAILAMGSRFDHGDPVSRGLFIREQLLCMPLPLPPDDVPPVPPWDGTTTQRERLAKHTEDPSCRACHQLMDPLGLPLEHYDAVGRYREDDHGLAIDPSGSVMGFGDPIEVDDAIDMAHALAELPEARACFVQSVFAYAYGRGPTEEDACELQRLVDAFEQSDGDVVELVVDIVSSDHFIVRRRTP